MASHTCPKCKHDMDQGRLSVTSNEMLTYLSARQTGILRQATRIDSARACANCGYVELYLDAEELKKRLG